MGLRDKLDSLDCGRAVESSGSKQAGPSQARSTAAARPRSRVSDDAQPSTGPCMSDTRDMTVAELKAEVSRYGYRPSKQRPQLEEQLRGIRGAARVPTVEVISDVSSSFHASPPASPPKQRVSQPPARRRQAQPSAGSASRATIDAPLSYSLSSDDEHDDGDHDEQHVDRRDLSLAMSAERGEEGRRRQVCDKERSSPATDEADETSGDGREDDEDEAPQVAEAAMGTVPAHVARQLHAAVLSDKELHRRILLFEPIAFDELNSLVNRIGIDGLRNKDMLRNWLDVQCICFYTADLTGQRTRY